MSEQVLTDLRKHAVNILAADDHPVYAAIHEIERLRAGLEQIRDIEKPMCGDQPETDWLAWYTTSSQQAEIADQTLSENFSSKEGVE